MKKGKFAIMTPALSEVLIEVIEAFPSHRKCAIETGLSHKTIWNIANNKFSVISKRTVDPLLQYSRRRPRLKLYTQGELAKMGIQNHRGKKPGANIFEVNGICYKKCKGPLHAAGVPVPISKFYHTRRKERGDTIELSNECKECKKKRQRESIGVEAYVPFANYQWMIIELVRKLGKAEAARRIGITKPMMWRYLNETKEVQMGRRTRIRQKWLRQATAKKIVTTLYQVRATGEVRHKDSIFHGSLARGHEEKIPVDREDFYIRQSDTETEERGKRRKTKMTV